MVYIDLSSNIGPFKKKKHEKYPNVLALSCTQASFTPAQNTNEGRTWCLRHHHASDCNLLIKLRIKDMFQAERKLGVMVKLIWFWFHSQCLGIIANLANFRGDTKQTKDERVHQNPNTLRGFAGFRGSIHPLSGANHTRNCFRNSSQCIEYVQ